jgi:cellobiose phosphorylase
MGLCRDLCNAIGDNANVLKIFEAMDVLKAAINEYGWTGKWYSYAIDDNGVKIGAPENPEGQLHLNPQTFAIFSDIAGPEHSAQCFEAVDKLMTEIGPLLVTPSYKNFKAGRIWRMEPGTFENGSMYFHGAAFKMMADLAAAKPDRALDTFLKILPSNPLNPPARSTIEPYALGNYYCGRENRYFGLNIFSHFTGSYPWLSKALVETMVGVRAEYDGLLIEPMLPSGWNQVNVKRKYRGRMYEINIARSPLPGTYDISLDGKLIAQGVSRIIAVKADRCEL